MVPTTTEGWAVFAIGLALVAWGVYRVVKYNGSLLGLALMAIGAILMPYRLVRLIGGIALAGLGGYMIYQGTTAQGAIYLLLGVFAVAESIRRRAAD